MKDKTMINQKHLLEVMNYNKITGEFRWLIRPSRNVNIGDIAGSLDKKHGYIFIRIDKKKYPAHRLAFMYIKGYLPKCIDHKNQLKTDNSWDNLRECTGKQNQYNKGLQKNNTSGYKGVSYCNTNKKYRAQARINKVNITIGYFINAELARDAYILYTKGIHNEFGFYPNSSLQGS